MATSMQSTGAGGDAGPPHINPNPASTSGSTTTAQPTDPIEMSDLEASRGTTTGAGSHLLNDVSIPSTSPISHSFPATQEPLNTNDENTKPADSAMASSSSKTPADSSTDPIASSSSASVPSSSTAPPPITTRMDSVAIGPETASTPIVANDTGPVLIITLLLTSGARHPYKIDEKYLNKRGVTVPDETENGKKDPFSISVYTLKELILREWREEWEAQPSSPSSIRLIYFGRLLDDKTALKECKFNADAANVVHMTVRPQDIVDEEDASKSKAQQAAQDGENTAGCRCVIL